MKKVFLYILFIGLFSCESERIIFKGPYHVRFTKIAQTEKETNSRFVPIEVHIAGPALGNDVTLFYTMTGNAREGVDFEIVGTRGKVTIAAGEYFGNIEVQLLNNANNILRTQDLIFTLTRVSSGNLEVGQGEGGIGKKFTLTILDDCILGGTYVGTRQGTSLPLEGISLTSSDCENYLVSDWNISNPFGLNHLFGFSLVFTDNGDNTLKIDNQKPPEFFDDDGTIFGEGTVNPVTNEIRLKIQYVKTDTLKSTITLNRE